MKTLSFIPSLKAVCTYFFTAFLCLASNFELGESTTVDVDTDTGSIQIHHNGKSILTIESILIDYAESTGMKIITADSQAVVLELSYPASVDYQHHADDTNDRTAELSIQHSQGGLRFHASPEWSNQITLVLKDSGDHQFGLTEPLQPDNRLSPDLRGTVIDVEVLSDGQTIVENYASAFSSLYMSSAGYGAFFDTFARGRYQFASTEQTHSIHHQTGELDWYVFFGTNGSEILKSYYHLIGAPKSVPIWAMGPILWRDDNKGGAAEILDDAARFDALKIPATAWFVDRPYSDGAHRWSQMNFGKGFENPGQWIQQLKTEHGVEFMTWTATAFFGDARFNHHLDDWHTYMDVSDETSVKAFQAELAKNQYAYGVKGHKMDRADENFPSYAPWTDHSVSEPERRNKYVYLFAKIHHDALTDAWGEDHFSFARAGIHRVQPYLSAIWAGDPRSSWQGFRGNFANAMRSGFIGFPVWGSDVGGYLGDGDIPEDLYTRWLQAGSMSGLFEIKLDGAGGQGKDRMPWHYPESLQNQFRKVCEDRMDLLPTLYSLANTSATNGVLMQPMAYADLTDKETYSIWDQYYLGDSILVAPVFTRSEEREVYFPKGKWYDFDDPSIQYEGGQRIIVPAPLEKLPRFVKANSLYLTGNIFRGSDRNWKQDETHLTLHAFPGMKGEQASFDYVDPSDSKQVSQITMHTKANAVEITLPSLAHATKVQWIANNAVKSASWNGKTIPFNTTDSIYDCNLEAAKMASGGTLIIEF